MPDNGINPTLMASLYRAGKYEKTVIVYGLLPEAEAEARALYELGVSEESFPIKKNYGSKVFLVSSEDSWDSVLLVDLAGLRS